MRGLALVFFIFLFFSFSAVIAQSEMPDYFQSLTSEPLSEYASGCTAPRNAFTLNFTDAKRVLRTMFLSLNGRTLYCQCRLVLSGGELGVDGSCPYRPRMNPAVNWEHVVPASRFGQLRACWKGDGCRGKRGRRCCQEVDPCFNRMEGDLHNLHAAINDLNYDRSNYMFGDVSGEERRYGGCDFEIDSSRRIAEPAPQIRGDIARSYLYMSWRYGFDLTDDEKMLFLRWNIEDPPDEAERRLEAARRRLQGNGNPFITGWKNPTS
jgi:deoxyribonuclease-1